MKKTTQIELKTFEVTWNQMIEPGKSDLENYYAYYHELAQKDPRKAIPKLENVIEKYPNEKIFYNYLSAAYAGINDDKKLDALIVSTYEKFPDYLFAKLAYANYCMRKDKIRKIPEIFNNEYDLVSLYPERHIFHISEVKGFHQFMADYFFIIGEDKLSQNYLDFLIEVDPDDPAPKEMKERRAQYQLLKKSLSRMIQHSKAKKKKSR